MSIDPVFMSNPPIDSYFIDIRCILPVHTNGWQIWSGSVLPLFALVERICQRITQIYCSDCFIIESKQVNIFNLLTWNLMSCHTKWNEFHHTTIANHIKNHQPFLFALYAFHKKRRKKRHRLMRNIHSSATCITCGTAPCLHFTRAEHNRNTWTTRKIAFFCLYSFNSNLMKRYHSQQTTSIPCTILH